MSTRVAWLGIGGVLLLMSSCASEAPAAPETGREGMVKRSDFEIVECLLPGVVRQIGNTTYLTQRRPTRTTANDCHVRGGEYVLYDRADVKSALRIWLAQAEGGDPEAQNNVGEIYERGVGATPDYAAAALWYAKAAKQGYPRALVNLGVLYEQGLGVAKDPLRALDLYRQAAGVPNDNLIYQSAAQREEDQLRAELTKTITEKQAQIEALAKQVSELERKLRTESHAASIAAGQSAELDALRGLLRQLQSDQSQAQTRLAAMPAHTDYAAPPPLPSDGAIKWVMGHQIGRFYALIIGNQDYQVLEHLQTPRTDATRVGQLLHDKYGFIVREVPDADDVAMLRALNDLDKVLREDDNLLIYYAGHGWRMKTGITEAGYWLPVNAERPPNDTFWVPNEQISAHVGRLAAKRILVVADSCFAGLLSTDPSVSLFGVQRAVSEAYLEFKLPKRARLLISSGGNEPVLDVGGNGDSVFARAFIDILQQNTGVLSTPELFAQLRERVKRAAAQNSFAQIPDFKTIKSAGDEMGDFFFVPRNAGS
jgi:uncharacterized protein